MTGDRKDVALSVCQRVGVNCSRILTGQEIENLEESQLQTAVEYGEVFAELTKSRNYSGIKGKWAYSRFFRRRAKRCSGNLRS